MPPRRSFGARKVRACAQHSLRAGLHVYFAIYSIYICTKLYTIVAISWSTKICTRRDEQVFVCVLVLCAARHTLLPFSNIRPTTIVLEALLLLTREPPAPCGKGATATLNPKMLHEIEAVSERVGGYCVVVVVVGMMNGDSIRRRKTAAQNSTHQTTSHHTNAKLHATHLTIQHTTHATESGAICPESRELLTSYHN